MNNIQIIMFKNLPPEQREGIIDLDGRIIDIKTVNPFSLVCVELSGNPGEVISKSLIPEGKTTFDYFKKKARELNFDISEFIKKLSERLVT